jgi:hypothetical protein
MRWTCWVCGIAETTTIGTLGVHVMPAKSGCFTPWRTVHGDCFDEAGMTYGVDFHDIDRRGLGFWLEHIGGKAWAANTDYVTAFTDIACRLGAAA